MPDPELVERPKRRRFSAEYKLRVLREADACSRPGEVGALLRREGLYTSHLTAWRKQRDAGALQALGRSRGRRLADRREAEIAALRRRAERAEAELAKARRVTEVQGNVSALLGNLLEPKARAGEHRAMIEQTVQELIPLVGTRPACRALGVAPATIYRRRRPPEPRPRRPRPVPARALSKREREAVLAELCSQRFADASPAQVWATLIDEGRYLCSERTMYRLLAAANGHARERRYQLVHPAYQRPELLAERANEVWSWDISKLKGPAEVDLLLSLRDPRRVQPVLRRLDRMPPRIGQSGRGADRPGD